MLKKKNYRPVSLLPHISKIFEQVIYKKINSYMENKLSKPITGFRKAHGTQHSSFTDLLKAFNTINHDLLLTKLKAYGFTNKSLALVCSYLKKQKTENAN